MANIDDLRTLAQQIKNETNVGANTAERVGTTFEKTVTELETIEGNVAAEATVRQQADATLQQAITDEAAARQAADTALRQADTTEKNARQDADASLQQAIADEATARQTADTTEKNARQAADASLQQAISNENAAREAADASLRQAIADEATTRQNVDGQLQQAIDAVLRPLWTNMGATYDAMTNTYTMNGLTGLTEENMVAAYQLYLTAIIGTGYTFNVGTLRTKIRTNFPLLENATNANEVTKIARPDKRFDFQQSFRGLSKIEVIRLGRNITATTQPLVLHENGLFSANTFQSCYLLKEITDALDVQFCAKVNGFGGTHSVSLPELRVLKLAKVHMDVNLNFCPLLYYTSLKYLVDNAANTEAITVTVHADVYAKLTRTYEGSVISLIGNEAAETGQDVMTLAGYWNKLPAAAAEKNISFAES